MNAQDMPSDHRTVLPDHRTEPGLPRPLAWTTHETAIWLGLIPVGTDQHSREALSAQRAVRNMIDKRELAGYFTGNRWFVSGASIIDLLDGLTGRSSEVAS